MQHKKSLDASGGNVTAAKSKGQSAKGKNRAAASNQTFGGYLSPGLLMNIGTDSLIGLAGFGVAYIASRLVRERALKLLSTEEKARLLDAFSGYRTYFMSAAVILPALYVVALKSWPAIQSFLTPIFFVAFGLLLVVMSWLTFRKLTELSLPKEYIRSFFISSGLQYLGIAALFAPLVIRSLR